MSPKFFTFPSRNTTKDLHSSQKIRPKTSILLRKTTGNLRSPEEVRLKIPPPPPSGRKYDLKGSTVDRDATTKELRKELPTLKDNDFVKDGMHVEIGNLAKEKLMDTLSADVAVSRGWGVGCWMLDDVVVGRMCVFGGDLQSRLMLTKMATFSSTMFV